MARSHVGAFTIFGGAPRPLVNHHVLRNIIWLTFLQAPPEPDFELRVGLFDAQRAPRCCLSAA